MTGIIRAEILRLRKRGALVLIVVAVPLLAVILFGLSYASIYDPGPFDPAALRADLIATGFVEGMPPDEAERYLDEYIANEATNRAMQLESVKLTRAAFAFPQSLVTVLGNATILLLALVLLTATTLGDEFGWGTIRTTLLGSSHRWRLLLVRLGALWLTAAVVLVLLLLIGGITPLFLGVSNRPLPSPMPGIDPGALAILLGGLLLVSLVVITFGTLATLLVRNGALTLVSVLIYVVVEAAVLVVLTRFAPFGTDSTGRPGDLAWMLDALPAHGLVTVLDVGARAASTMVRYEGEVIRPIRDVTVPLLGFAGWAALFGSLALWRFRRMDIVE